MTTYHYHELPTSIEDVNAPQELPREHNNTPIQEQEKFRKNLTLEERKNKLNSLFGVRPWKPHVTKRPLEERSPEVKTLYVEPPPTTVTPPDSFLTFWNVMWTLFFGWWLSLIYIAIAFLLALTFFGIPYAKWCWQLKSYFFWPFGKFIVRLNAYFDTDEERRLLKAQRPFCPRRNIIGFVFWLLFAFFILLPAHIVCFILTWMLIIFIPMAKVNLRCIRLLFQSPLTLRIENSYPGPAADVKLCTHQAVNIYYYKYSIGGMNVILFNLIPFVIFSLIEGYLVPARYALPPMLMFCVDILSIIPISFYIGMAVSCISVQTRYIVGALLNVGFGTIVEIILYAVAIKSGSLDALVQFGITGSLLAAMLLLPGLSMTAGGLKYKEQSFNPVSAGVSSVMLTVSVAGNL
jgi:Ca2+:H+ antiporter